MDAGREALIQADERRYAEEAMRRAVVSYPPRWATIAIGSRCTNRCVFCSYHSLDARGGRSKVYGLNYTMSLERFRRLVDFFHAGRVPHVHICSTGDPLLHPDVIPMVDYVIEKYGRASLQSNFNRNILERGDSLRQILERSDRIAYITTDLHAGEDADFDSIKKGSSLTDLLGTLRVLSDHGIRLTATCILTRSNHATLPRLIERVAEAGIRVQLNVINVYAYGFNAFTAQENLYRAADTDITRCLERCRELADRLGVELLLPLPHDDPSHVCDVFWTKVQVWPVAGNDPARYDENLISHACAAVVLGDINTLGYASDYASVMDFWNNEKLVGYREKILAGKYPDPQCWGCCHAVGLRP